jgi:hypothetical protein
MSDAATPVVISQVGTFVAGTGLCGIAFDHTTSTLLAYPCSGTDVLRFTTDGSPLSPIPRPGESANDVDVDVAPVAFNLGSTAVAEGTPLFINGESGAAEIYALGVAADGGAPAFITEFGASHVVGGGYHAARGTLFLLQDQVPGATNGNLVAEIDVATGAVLDTFSLLPNFDVNYGDMDVCQSSGHLFFVSSIATTIGEFTADGTFIALHSLPPTGPSSLSGIGLDDATGEAWVAGTGGGIWHLTGLPCGPP